MFFLSTQHRDSFTVTTARLYELEEDTVSVTHVKVYSRDNGKDFQTVSGPYELDASYITEEGHAFMNFGHDGTLHTL